MLMILDGWGISPEKDANAVSIARTPFLDSLRSDYPSTQLKCSGAAVGLPEGIMGNSEVGHLNIGAGRVVFQDLMRIDNAIRDKSFFQNETLKAMMSKVKAGNAALHLMGLVSDGGVHSQLSHLFALLDMARDLGLEQVFVHAILDGRDTPPDSGVVYVTRLQAHITKNSFGKIASICGRYYAMDRDKRWERVEKAYHLYVTGEGTLETDPVKSVKNAYARKETDEFVTPIAISDADGAPTGSVKDGDGIIFFNYRADRAREITRAFVDSNFDGFARDHQPQLCDFVGMTLYDETLGLPMVFPPQYMQQILGEVISSHGLRQLRIAETEKYAHVTYFFNGGEEKEFPLEDRCLIPSPREVATYDLKPEMSAPAVTAELLKRLESDQYAFIVLNFANLDMVGHTGVIDAAIKACETIDACVEQLITRAKRKGWRVLLTADHGNAEMMMDDNGGPHTAHTLNPVPLVLVDESRENVTLRQGALCDIAPTILEIMGIDPPKEMTGKSLIIK